MLETPEKLENLNAASELLDSSPFLYDADLESRTGFEATDSVSQDSESLSLAGMPERDLLLGWAGLFGLLVRVTTGSRRQ